LIEIASKKKVQYREVITFPNLERVTLGEETLSHNLQSYQPGPAVLTVWTNGR
jgi:hypothetical protein